MLVKVGTEACPCDGISDGGNLCNIAVGFCTINMDGYPLGESLGVEYGAKGGSSGDISCGDIEGSELGESGTNVCSPGEMSGGNEYGMIEGSPLGDK